MKMYNDSYEILEIIHNYSSEKKPCGSPWVLDQVIGLQELGYNPLVISPTPIIPFKQFLPKKYNFSDEPSKDIEIYRTTKVLRPPYFKIPNNRMVGFTLQNLSKCIYYSGNFKSVKLIHAHFGQNGVAALRLKEKLQIPLITSFYGYDSGRLSHIFKPYYKDLIRKGDLFLALSNDMKSDLLLLGFPENKISIHHLGVDVDRFSVNPVSSKVFTILTVAGLNEAKGIQYVLKALKDFFDSYPKEKQFIKYHIVGGGIYEIVLKKLVEVYELQSVVSFTNNQIVKNGREIVLAEMKSCDIFVLSSSTTKSGHKEGTPVVLMEAQACGKPCISTLHAGIPEVVLHNKTGILVNEHSPKEIMKAIEVLYFNKEIRQKFGESARNHIELFFNNIIQVKRLKSIYENLTRY